VKTVPARTPRKRRPVKSTGQTVLITGADTFWGRQVAAALAAEAGIGRLILLADEWTGLKPRRSRTVRMDPRDLEIEHLLRREKVQVVYHLDYTETYRRNEDVFDRNVIGTLTVLAACAAARVRKVVIRSSQMVYGAMHNNPWYLSERRALRGRHYLPYLRDLCDMERYGAETRNRHPEMCVTVVRLAHVVGANCDSPLLRYVRSSRAPILSGFEPLFQVIHESDAVEALVQAHRVNVPGPVNVGADGVLPLLKMLRLARTRTISMLHPIAYAAAEWLRGIPPFGTCPLELDYLRYSCMGDNARMKAEFDFQPQLASDEAFVKALAEIQPTRVRPCADTGPEDGEADI
jgi:UDP-glucose 4-epimerase